MDMNGRASGAEYLARVTWFPDGSLVVHRGRVEQVAALGAGGGPQAEGAVDVDPRAGGMAGLHDLVQRIEGAAVDVAGLGAHDRRAVDTGRRTDTSCLIQTTREDRLPSHYFSKQLFY
jgi:hypothetical protein